jgi:hypothetical protein
MIEIISFSESLDASNNGKFCKRGKTLFFKNYHYSHHHCIYFKSKNRSQVKNFRQLLKERHPNPDNLKFEDLETTLKHFNRQLKLKEV